MCERVCEFVLKRSATFYSGRKRVNHTTSKLVVVKYSPEIFRIRTKKEPTGEKRFSSNKIK